MSIECGECERDMRGPHSEDCSRYTLPGKCKHCPHDEYQHDEEGFCMECNCLFEEVVESVKAVDSGTHYDDMDMGYRQSHNK